MAEATAESGTPTRKARGSIFSSIRTSVLPRGSLMPTTIMATMMGPEEKAEWTDAETPLLRPRVRTKEELENVNLIVAVHDYDTGRFDDLLGTILVPIGAAAAAKAGHAVRTVGEDEYEVTLNEAPLVLGNARFVGEISCVLHVSGGAAIRPALARAAQAGCGARATTAEFRRSWMLRMWAKVVKAFGLGGSKVAPPVPEGRHHAGVAAPAGASDEVPPSMAATGQGVSMGEIDVGGMTPRSAAAATTVAFRWELPSGCVVILTFDKPTKHSSVMVNGTLAAEADGLGDFAVEVPSTAGKTCAISVRQDVAGNWNFDLSVDGKHPGGGRVDPPRVAYKKTKSSASTLEAVSETAESSEVNPNLRRSSEINPNLIIDRTSELEPSE